MDDERFFGPKVVHGSAVGSAASTSFSDGNRNGQSALTRHSFAMDSKDEDRYDEPKRLSIELPTELQDHHHPQNGRPRKRSSWFSEMCLGKESKMMNGLEMAAVATPSSSSMISGPDGKSRSRGGGVGSRFRASIYSVLGKLGTCPESTQGGVCKRSILFLHTPTHHLLSMTNQCRR